MAIYSVYFDWFRYSQGIQKSEVFPVPIPNYEIN